MEDDEAWLYGEDQATESKADKDENKEAEVSIIVYGNVSLQTFIHFFNNYPKYFLIRKLII